MLFGFLLVMLGAFLSLAAWGLSIGSLGGPYEDRTHQALEVGIFLALLVVPALACFTAGIMIMIR